MLNAKLTSYIFLLLFTLRCFGGAQDDSSACARILGITEPVINLIAKQMDDELMTYLVQNKMIITEIVDDWNDFLVVGQCNISFADEKIIIDISMEHSYEQEQFALESVKLMRKAKAKALLERCNEKTIEHKDEYFTSQYKSVGRYDERTDVCFGTLKIESKGEISLDEFREKVDMVQRASPLSPDLLRLKKMGRETILKAIAMDRETERRRAKLAANKVESKRCYTQLEEMAKKSAARGTNQTAELEVILAQDGGERRKAELEDWMARSFACDQEARETFRTKSAECWNLGS